MTASLAVVIPVFNAPGQLRRCLEAVRRTVDPTTPVIVIDDASDRPEVADVLGDHADGWTVMRNAGNLGFVATANRGMVAAAPADVVLLNSDTVPAGQWLARLSACLEFDPAIASATPFTNNGEIASLPELCTAAPVPADPEDWARACLDAGPPRYPEIPTAVGFCMAMKRRCIDAIGGFDEQAFGRGYGEENDWCMRADEAGWRHVLCDDAFVAHEGNASFGPLGLGPDDRAMQTLLARHPDYLDRVRTFIARDPLAPARARVMERLRTGA
ncbi:MAG: glycosyltransferase family 2 protein [Candidatus Wenzhouxiangella sp. M2_3B_020]